MSIRCASLRPTLRWGLAILGPAFLLSSGVSAQGGIRASAFAGITLPTGEFADQVGESAGLAIHGWAVGVDIAVPIVGDRGLSWYSSLEGLTFGVSEEFMSEFMGSGIQVALTRGYLGSVLATGLRYDVPANPSLVLHLSGQFGAGFFKAPDAAFSGMGQTVQLVSYFTPVHGLGGSLGATVNDRVTVDAKYFYLRNPEIEGELRSGGLTETLDGEQPMAWLRVALGLRIR